MISLTRRLKDESGQGGNSGKSNGNNNVIGGRASIRDKLLVSEIAEMENHLPYGAKVKFDNPDCLHEFHLCLCPDEGFWEGGKFRFHIFIGEDYNLTPPVVKCNTKLWHPNINEEGNICLSLLRESSLDGMGWAPTRKLKDVVWGLNSLFTDLLNFDDPLNIEAAEHYLRDKDDFRNKVKDWTSKYAKR